MFALIAALVAFIASVSMTAVPAGAQSTEVAPLAGQPHIDAEGSGRVVHKDFFFSDPNAGAKARAWVHSGSDCGNSFCTIQRYNNDRYRAYKLTGCDIYDLDNFVGEYDAHNHGTSRVNLLNDSYTIIGWRGGGSSTNVNWSPVGKIGLCNRS